MPPAYVPSALCTSKKPRTSSMTSSKCRVLYPLADSTVLPCMGSHTHTTTAPPLVTFSPMGGEQVASPAPAHPGDRDDPPGQAVGVEPLDEGDSILGPRGW